MENPTTVLIKFVREIRFTKIVTRGVGGTWNLQDDIVDLDFDSEV